MYAYQKQSKVDVRVARIFNTFGPRMHPNDGRVVSNFIIQALQNKDITIYGNGEQTRSFQYVSDLVEGLIRLMNGGEKLRGAKRRAGNGKIARVTVWREATSIKNILN